MICTQRREKVLVCVKLTVSYRENMCVKGVTLETRVKYLVIDINTKEAQSCNTRRADGKEEAGKDLRECGGVQPWFATLSKAGSLGRVDALVQDPQKRNETSVEGVE